MLPIRMWMTEVTEGLGDRGVKGLLSYTTYYKNEDHLTPFLHKIECYQVEFLLLKKKDAIGIL